VYPESHSFAMRLQANETWSLQHISSLHVLQACRTRDYYAANTVKVVNSSQY
jgi:hypothetical protein